jgi:hypothetical protein
MVSHSEAQSPSTPTGVAKRRRNRHACDACRRKRAKCDGNLPCQSCQSAQVECTFTPPKKRGVPTGFIQRLETTNEKLISLVGLIMQNATDGEKLVACLASQVAAESETDTRDRFLQNRGIVLAMLEVEDADDVSTRPVRKRTASPSEHAGEDADTAVGDEPLRFMGPSSGFDDSFYDSFQKLNLSQTSFDVASWKSLISPLSAIDLLDTYFAFTHQLFPMVDKGKLVQHLYSPESSKKTASSCLLWTAIIMGLNHHNVGTPQQDSYKSRVVHDLTICTLDCKFTVESVQALLMQSIYFFGKGHWSNSWLIVGNAVRMGMDIGLHINRNSATDRYSRRTWKCCCIIDTLISGRLGRAPQVSTDNYFDEPEEETAEEWELWRPTSLINNAANPGTSSSSSGSGEMLWVAEPARTVSIFNKFFDISKLVTKFITTANSPRFAQMTREERFAEVENAAQEMELLTISLPPHLSVENSSNTKQLLPHQASMYLAYYSFLAMLHIIDGPSVISKNLINPEALVGLQVNVLKNYLSRFTASKSLPTFEYFLSLGMSFYVKSVLDGCQGPVSLADNDDFNVLLGFLREFSTVWGGASVSYKYFSKMKETQVNREDYQKRAAPFVLSPFGSASLDIADLGDFEDFDFFQAMKPSGMPPDMGGGALQTDFPSMFGAQFQADYLPSNP